MWLELWVTRVRVVGVKSLYNGETRSQYFATNHLLYTSGDWNLNTREIIVGSTTTPLLPLDGFCLGEWRYLLSSSSWPFRPPSLGFLPSFIVDTHSWSSLLPLFSPHHLCTSLRFCTVGNPSRFAYGRRCCLPSPLRSTSRFQLCVPGRGTVRFVTSWPHLSPRCRKSIGRGCSSRSFLAFGSTPPSSSLVFVPLFGYSYTPLPELVPHY